MKQFSKILTLVGLCLLLSKAIAGQQPPNLIGIWEAVSGSWSYTGTKYNPLETKLSNQPLHSKLEIIEQSGGAFSGDFLRFDGKGRIVAGVISPDGESVYMSLDSSSAFGKLSQNNSTLSLCGTTNSNMYNRAYCTVYKRKAQ